MSIPTPYRFFLRTVLAGGCLSVLCLSTSQAQNLYWNPPSGNSWSTSAVNWSVTSGGAPTQAWVSGVSVAEIANFGGGGGSVSLEENISAGGLRFNEDGYTLAASAARTLSFTGSAPEIYVGSGDHATLGANIQVLGAGKKVVKTGSGTLELASSASFLGTGSPADGSQLAVQEGVLRVTGNGLANTRTVVSVNAGASLLLDSSISIGGLSGGGSVSRTGTLTYLIFRGVGSDFSGVISGNISLEKQNGNGVQTFSGNASNTFTDRMTVRIGTVAFAKQSGAIAMSGSEIILAAGSALTSQVRLDGSEQVVDTAGLTFALNNKGTATFNLNGFSETMGLLTVNNLGDANGLNRIDFGLNMTAQVLQFSSLLINSSGHLDILNFNHEHDSLRFLADPTSQLSRLTFDGEAAYAFNQGTYWSVTSIPEPASGSLLGLAGLSLAVWQIRRRIGKRH